MKNFFFSIIAEVHAAEVSEDSDDSDGESDDSDADSDNEEGSATARSGGPIIAPPPAPSGNQGKSANIHLKFY